MRAVLHHDGGSGPALLYVPGIDGSGELLLGTAERLEQRFRLLRVRYEDGGDDSLEALAAGIAGVLDDAGVERALVLAESFGGPVALRLALDRPERVRALALVNTFAWYPRRVYVALTSLVARVLPQSVFAWFRPRIARNQLFGALCEDDALRRFEESAVTLFDEAYRKRLGLVRSLDLRARLGEVTAPVALFASEADRVVPAVRCARELAAGLPHAALRTIPRGGHVVLPLRALPWVEWLAELDARAALADPGPGTDPTKTP